MDFRMSLRWKLIGATMTVALLVPLLGGVAISRVTAISDDVHELSTEIPELVSVKELERLQNEQQRAVLGYVSNGNPQELTAFQDGSAAFDQRFAELKESSKENSDLLAGIEEDRSRFLAVAQQLLGSRATLDRALTDLRARDKETQDELASIRQRYVPTATNAAVDATSIPGTLRNQINDLLLGTEGMLHIVGSQSSLATGYALRPDEAAKQQFTAITPVFTNWFNIANAAGGTDDRAILARVQNRYVNQFEPAGRQIIQATDFANTARGSFTEASTNVTGRLNQIVAGQLDQVTDAHQNARSIADGAANSMFFITAMAFLIAAVVAFVLANAIVTPVVHLRNVADRVSRGEIDDVEIEVKSQDEIGDLAGAFRRMVASVRFLMAGDAEEEPAIEPFFGAGPTPSAAGD
jgi:HAMP domain-containing protein